MLTTRPFTSMLHWEDDLCVADCPEVGTVSQGVNAIQALANLREATELYLEVFEPPETFLGRTRNVRNQMTAAIQQSVEFSATPAALFEMYMDSKKHSAATGGAAKISRKAGGAFTAWGGQLRGKNLLIVPKRMIVQSWRSTNFKKGDADSILVITFSKTSTGGRVDLVHAGVPEQDHEGVTQGWAKYYWEPWRAYLEKRGKG